MSIFSNLFSVPKGVSSTVNKIMKSPVNISMAHLSAVNYYNPYRSVISQNINLKYNNGRYRAVPPTFDVPTIQKFYDSVVGDRPIIMYERSKGIFLTDHETLFSIYSVDGVVDEDGYEVIYPAGLFTLSIGGKYKTGIPYKDISGLTNDIGFTGAFSPVDKIIRHKVKKPIVKFRSTLGESETTKDHSYILMNGESTSPDNLEEFVPGRLRYMQYDTEMFSYIRFLRGSHDILFSDSEVIVSSPSFTEFVNFVISNLNNASYEDGVYKLPVNPFLIGLLDNNINGEFDKHFSDEFILIDEGSHKRIYDKIDRLFNKFKVISSWAFDIQFLQVLSANLFDVSSRSYKMKSKWLASLISFYFMVSEIDYAIYYEDGYYKFIDTRMSGLPINYTNIRFDFKDDYEGYVYDLSVANTQCFVDPIGMITLHNTDGILRDAVSYYTSRIPLDDLKIVADKRLTNKYLTYRIKKMNDVFGCDLLGSFLRDIISNLVLFGNVIIHRVRSRKKYRGKKVVLYYEILPFADISLVYDIQTSKFKGYLVRNVGLMQPDDVIHIYINKPAGFFYGRPNTLAVLNDIKVLRLLEQNLEIMGVAYSTPQLVLKIGTPMAPASNPPNQILGNNNKYYNITDADIQMNADRLKKLTPHDIKIIPWYYHIEGVNVTPPIDLVEPIKLFRHRIYQAMGLDPVVMGDTDSRNRDASAVGQRSTDRNVAMYLDVVINAFNREIINHDFLDEMGISGSAYIHTPRIDMEDYFRRVNLGLSLFQSNIITQDEVRRDYLGLDPMSSKDIGNTFIAITGQVAGGGESAASKAQSQVNPTNQHGNQGAPPTVKKN